MAEPIAIVGMACRYPGARSPEELWENVLAERRMFRRLPPERLRLEDYWSSERDAPDRTYCTDAAVLADYRFDRVAFRVVGETFRSADWSHWLALDVACEAVAAAGFGSSERELPRERTGVFVGNTLTGEFSRASLLRLRWPYVARVVAAELDELGWDADRRAAFLERVEERFKSPFPPIGSETLSGGLANTIAGRICNHLDLKGGGYVVDGACASSSLAVAEACAALSAGDVDLAIAGGVDLSLDPAELVGFAKVGALAQDEMRVFDEHPSGFFPGEGAGMVVLMRARDAAANGHSVATQIRGWGIASDGSGGISRPEADGQYLALRRAYERAGFGPDTVAYFECHGTGTEVGDRAELQALDRIRREAGSGSPAAVGTIKANIGHTKAAAGVAALIKAAKAVESQVVPPTTGCRRPHAVLAAEQPVLRAVPRGEPWPRDMPVRAGVSAFGFGGIDTHLVVESAGSRRREGLDAREVELVNTPQDRELVLIGAADVEGLRGQIERLRGCTSWLARAELADVAAHLARTLPERPRLRAAVTAATPAELDARLAELAGWLDDDGAPALRLSPAVQLGRGEGRPRIGFLFPGQGAPVHRDAGAVGRRFPDSAAVYHGLTLAGDDGAVPGERVQAAVVASSLAALRALGRLGIEAEVAVGHSLGELTALHWAGAIDAPALLRLAQARGEAMTRHATERGAMAGLYAPDAAVDDLVDGLDVTVACFNSPRQRVVSGPADAVGAVVERAHCAGVRAVPLRVTGAFHSPLMAEAAAIFERELAGQRLRPLERAAVSTVTGRRLEPDADLRALLAEQILRPVRFTEAVEAVAADVDLLIEVGPGGTLAGLVEEIGDTPTVSTRAGDESLGGLLAAAGAAWAAGTPVAADALFEHRLLAPLDPDRRPSFLANPCEEAPIPAGGLAGGSRSEPPAREAAPAVPEPPGGAAEAGLGAGGDADDALSVVRRELALVAELPEEAIADDARLLGDLHMNSITISEVAVTAARALGRTAPFAPMDLADPTVAQLAEALETLGDGAGPSDAEPAGLEPWVRLFALELREALPSRYRAPAPLRSCTVLGSDELPIVTALRAAAEADPGADDGDDAERAVLVCLPPDADERHVPLLLEGARRCREAPGFTRFALVQQGAGAASFARSLFLESPEVPTAVVGLPEGSARADLVLEEVAAATGYAEAHYDADGNRREPRIVALPDPPGDGALPLGPGDVLLVTGGGRGIGAECARAVGQRSGARLALVGRSDPGEDAELAAGLARFDAAGLEYRYAIADVCDGDAVAAAVAQLERELGPVTGVLHAAGTNTPRRVAELTADDVRRTAAPKVDGLRNVVAAVAPERLRVLVTFGSAAAVAGMPAGADYALANEWQTRLTEELQRRHPRCRCVAVEWSNWAEVGMGVRLGAVERLAALGVTPIPPERGTDLLVRLLHAGSPHVATVVSGRFGRVPTIRLEESELPLHRFLEQPRAFYPGVELIADAELDLELDPYLGDHQIRGVKVFPAVMGLEAMAQAAMAVTGRAAPPTAFTDVAFERPVVLGMLDERRVIRVLALVRSPDAVEVVVRSDETEFQVDHMRAVCRFESQPEAQRAESRIDAAAGDPPLPLDPEELYDGLLFQRGRFRRVAGYRQLRADRALADIAADGRSRWFGGPMPEDLVLGDPGARDAAVHAGQLSMPDVVRLPTAVERIELRRAPGCATELTLVRERAPGDGGEAEAVLDVLMADGRGHVHELWWGVRSRVVGEAGGTAAWPALLYGPYVERRVRELTGRRVGVAVFADDGAADGDERAVRYALAGRGEWKRSNGAPAERVDAAVVRGAGLLLAVAGEGRVACDAGTVERRDADAWREALGEPGWQLAAEVTDRTGEELDVAGSRILSAAACLGRARRGQSVPLRLEQTARDGWVSFAAGDDVVLTWGTQPRPDDGSALVLGVLVDRVER